MFSAPWFFWGLLAGNCSPPTDLFLPHSHTHTHTHISPVCLSLSFLCSLSSFQVHSHPSTPPHPLSIYVSPLALPRFFPISPPFEVWDSSKSSVVLFWTAKGKWLRKRGSSSITAVNQKIYTAQRGVMWEMILVFDLSKPLYVTCTVLYEDILHCTFAHTCSRGRLIKMKTQNAHPWRYARKDKWNCKQNKYSSIKNKYPRSR